MGKCILAKLEKNGIVKYTCDQVRLLNVKWKKEYQKMNKTEEIEKLGINDVAYKRYCQELDEFLTQCKCLDNLICDKCLPEDHDGHFCRCVSRNIALGKKLRSENKSPWKKERELSDQEDNNLNN